MITGNEAENRRWDAYYDRIFRGPELPPVSFPDEAGLTAERVRDWLYETRGNIMQIAPPEPPPLSRTQAAFYAKPGTRLGVPPTWRAAR